VLFPTVLLLPLTCCDGGVDGTKPLLVDATVAFPPRDTVHAALPAITHRCTDGRTILLEAVSPEGSGVLVRLHFRDSLRSGSSRVVVPGDTSAPGAVVAVRYVVGDVPRTVSLDSGTVELRRAGDRISGRIQGSGVQSAIRTPAWIRYSDVPLPAPSDTASCAFQR
jgi:hypothetical protein